MAQFRHGAISDFTRGGQTTLHFLRMIAQVFRSGLKLGSGVWLALAGVILYAWVQAGEVWTLVNWLWAGVWVKGLDRPYHSFEVFSFFWPSKAGLWVPAQAFFEDLTVRQIVGDLWAKVWVSGLVAFGLCATAIVVIAGYLFRLGHRQAESELVRGVTLDEDAKRFRQTVKQATTVGRLSLAGVPLPKASETNHVLLVGSPGTGKSTALRQLMQSAREAYPQANAMVYDVSGDLMKALYQEGDLIFNPFDARTVHWNLWEECSEDYELDTLAASLIPEPKSGDPFWSNAARTVFVAAAKKMRADPERSNQNLFNTLCRGKIADLLCYLQHTEAESVLSEEAEKTAASIRSVLATYVKPLGLVPDDSDERFSLQRWMPQKQGRWLWLTVTANQRETLKPLITMLLDRAFNTLLSSEVDSKRRFFLFADELPSLNKLPSIETFLAQGRKYGGLGVIGFQNIAQMKELYGDYGAESITGSCRTWLVLRCNDHRSAEWASAAFGENEWMESNEHISYGANEIRDGVSISKQRNRRRVILAAQVSKLADCSGYLRLGYGLPIGLVRFRYDGMVERVEPFVARSTGSEVSEGEAGEIESNNETIDPIVEQSVRTESVVDVEYLDDLNDDADIENQPKAKAVKKKLPRRVVDVTADGGVL